MLTERRQHRVSRDGRLSHDRGKRLDRLESLRFHLDQQACPSGPAELIGMRLGGRLEDHRVPWTVGASAPGLLRVGSRRHKTKARLHVLVPWEATKRRLYELLEDEAADGLSAPHAPLRRNMNVRHLTLR